MNWVKDKTFRMLFFVGIAIILCSIPFIFSFTAWGKLPPFMSMAGGGVIGVAIALKLQSRPKDNRKTHEKGLKRKAWKDFLSLIAFSVFGFLIYGFLTYTDAKGTPMLIGSFAMIASMGIGAIVSIFNKKNPPVPEFDERELYLLRRATNIGTNCFMFYVVIIMLVAFSLIGGRGMVPMWSIPVALFSGLLFAGTVQFLILLHHAKEDEKNTVGGTA